LTRLDGKDIRGISASGVGMSSAAQKTVSLRDIRGVISADIASAMGFNANANVENITKDRTAGVTTLKGAMAVMSIAETAQKMLDRVRSDLGSVQNQLVSTVNNISVTQVNVKAAESNIRDVDFAAESANFSKYNILAQSGSYAMSQANAVQQNVLKLLQ
jgi:flagellin